MSLVGTLGGNTSRTRPFEKGRVFLFGKEKGENDMTVFEELKARGLLAQLTDEEEIKELLQDFMNLYKKVNTSQPVRVR